MSAPREQLFAEAAASVVSAALHEMWLFGLVTGERCAPFAAHKLTGRNGMHHSQPALLPSVMMEAVVMAHFTFQLGGNPLDEKEV